MPALPQFLLPAALLLALAGPALAASSTSSAVSDSASTSVGASSNSVERSSKSSSKGKDVAAGDYRVVDVAAAPGRPGTVRMTLQALADGSADGELFLYLPQEAADASRVGPGHVVSVKRRPYGYEFAAGPAREAFFLVLDDEWMRGLQTRAVTL